LIIIFVLALGRFFQALAGLDAGSSFGGMGSSREMFISSFVEPVACLSIFSLILSGANFSVSTILTGLALLTVILTETSRLPVDNQETHLELTMIHEAMVLDYSGPHLAIIELASYIRQIFWITLLALIILPTYPLIAIGSAVIAICVLIAFIEIGIAKFRLFRVPNLLMFGFLLALLSIAAALVRI
jgi:formate hydrogenlyase subunit 4